MASFPGKICWKRLRMRENKNYCSVPFRSYQKSNRKFQKKSKKIRKIKNNHSGFISSQNRLEMAEERRK